MCADALLAHDALDRNDLAIANVGCRAARCDPGTGFGYSLIAEPCG
jgi:hypothetical protein